MPPTEELPSPPIELPQFRKRSSGFSSASTVVPPIDEFEPKILLPRAGITNIDENAVDPECDIEVERMFMLPCSPNVERHLYENKKNFKEDSVVDVLRGCCKRFEWFHKQCDKQIETLTNEICRCPCGQPKLLVFVVHLSREGQGTYGHQINMSHKSVKWLHGRIGIHGIWLPRLLGSPDYWSAFASKSKNTTQGDSYEFCCQHPRWTQRSRHDKSVHTSPCSVYLHHNLSSELSTYFIAASPGEDWISSLKEVLKPADSTPSEQQTIFKSVAGSPFSLHAVMSGVAFVHSQEYVKVVRDRLMNQIRKVNDYSEQPAKRSGNLQSLQGNVEERVMLENVTKDLHLVSQTADTGIANADMAIKIHEEMLDAFKQLQAHVNLQSHRNTVNSTEDALRYTLKSMQCQRNWLVSYKARKDTAMNFVFNIVTQQDSAANVDIAFKMAHDGSSIKAITILTMIFLPGTFVAGIFSSQVFGVSKSGSTELTPFFWPFIGLVLVFTSITVTLWYFRVHLVVQCQRTIGRLRHRPRVVSNNSPV